MWCWRKYRRLLERRCFHFDRQEPFSCSERRTHLLVFLRLWYICVASSFSIWGFLCLCGLWPSTSPVCLLRRMRCIRDMPEHTQTWWNLGGFNAPHIFCTRRGREQLGQLCVAFTWLNGSLCIHAISFCIILMAEWICWYKPFWTRCGESFQ